MRVELLPLEAQKGEGKQKVDVSKQTENVAVIKTDKKSVAYCTSTS